MLDLFIATVGIMIIKESGPNKNQAIDMNRRNLI